MLAPLGMAALIGACGGGGDEAVDDTDTPLPDGVDRVQALVASATSPNCLRVPAAATPTGQRQVRDFGALPDDSHDDTDAIQHALDALRAGQTLVFSPGRYLISRSLRVRNPGITITGAGATIHATNPDNQALIIEADNTTVSSLTFTAVTDVRRSAAWHSRIVVAADIGSGYRPVYNTVIRNNRIVNAGAPGTSTANSASGGGILLLRANGFLVANNTVVRTLADGIHVSAASKNGRILNNVVRETGDDMIGVVSYTSNTRPISPATVLSSWNTRVESYLVRNVLIAGNQLGGQYWGRGISVVGGQSITISRNTIDNVPLAAGVFLAREAGYQTFGVENVLIESNLIRNVQNMSPPYDFHNKFATASRAGHGAVEIQAGLFEDDEATNLSFREAVAVRNVLMRGNVVDRATYSGARAGVNLVQTVTLTDSSGRLVQRHVVAGEVHNVGFASGQFNNVIGYNTPGRAAIRVPSVELSTHGVYCTGNNRDGAVYQPSVCKQAVEPAVRGAPLNCSPEGVLLQ